MIESLSRRGKQVKVERRRIKLGEIEGTLSQLVGIKQATVLAVDEREKTLAARVVPQGEALCVTDHRSPALLQTWHAFAGTLPCYAISPETSAERVADFLQHRLLKLGPGHTADTNLLPLINSLVIQPRWQAVVGHQLTFLMTQRRLEPAAEGYQVCTGEEHGDGHPHFSGHDLTLSQVPRGARNELSSLSDAQQLPESLTSNYPANASYIQELATTC